MAFELKQEGFQLKDILIVVDIPEATYHYHVKIFGEEYSGTGLKDLIKEQFYLFKERFGYKRIPTELQKLDHSISHKKVYRFMKEIGLKCVKFMRKSHKYNSYKGKVGKAAENRMNRRLNTHIPLQKLVKDITEFKCAGDAKLYLNPILDLYNGEIISFGIMKRLILNPVM